MIIALQYYAGDAEPTMALARLMADLQTWRRTEVLLAFVCQPGTERTPLVERTVAHCRRKFPVVEVVSPMGATGHPQACTALWAGTVSHFVAQHKAGTLGQGTDYECALSRGAAIFTLDGGDAVPLHRNWINMVIAEHERTLKEGKLITGSPYFMGTCPLHVNPNAVFQLEVFDRTKFLSDVPVYDGSLGTNFDVYHREEMLANARLTSLVRTDWRGAGREATLDLLRGRAREAVLLHGYKDKNLRWLARQLIQENPDSEPRVASYTLEDLRVQESVRRDFEAAQL